VFSVSFCICIVGGGRFCFYGTWFVYVNFGFRGVRWADVGLFDTFLIFFVSVRRAVFNCGFGVYDGPQDSH